MPKVKRKKKFRTAIRIANRRIQSPSFFTKRDMGIWRSEMIQKKMRIESGLESLPEKKRFSDFVNHWFEQRGNSHPESTLCVERSRINNHILPEFGDRNIHEIRTADIEDFLFGLSSAHKIKGATLNRYRALLHKIFEDAVKRGYVKDNPVGRVSRLKENPKWNYWETEEEITRYLRETLFIGDDFNLFTLLALNTGMRIGEILGLRWGSVSLENRRIQVCCILEKCTGVIRNRTKSGKSRYIGINNVLFEALQSRLSRAQHRSSSDPVLCTSEGRPLSARSLSDLHRKACVAAGVKPIRIHDLRHTFASHFVMGKGSLTELQFILGHSSPIMTMKYAHLRPDALRGAAERVSFGSVRETHPVVDLSAFRQKRDEVERVVH